MTLSLLLVFVSTSSSTIIPLTFAPWVTPRVAEWQRTGGSPIIDAEFGYTSTRRPHVVHLGIVGDTFVPMEELAVGAFSIPRIRIPTTPNGSLLGITRQQWPIAVLRFDGRPNTIGVGPGSDMLRFGGPTDFVRQNTTGGFLRLGASDDWFITHDCLPDSVVRMAAVIGYSTPRRIDAAVTARVETRVSVSIGDNVITTNAVTILDSKEILLTMPHTWVADIYSSLSPYLDRFRYRTVLRGCANNIQRLPVITLTFTAGGLHLFPEDYTRPTDQDDICELMITSAPVWQADQMIRFNPLLIPGINARSTDNEIILCDSALNL
jgi:hypothetical protein